MVSSPSDTASGTRCYIFIITFSILFHCFYLFSVRLHLHHLPIGGLFRISCHRHDRRLLNCHSRFVEIEQKYDTAYSICVKVSLIFFFSLTSFFFNFNKNDAEKEAILISDIIWGTFIAFT